MPGKKRKPQTGEAIKSERASVRSTPVQGVQSSESREIAELKRMQEQLQRRADELEVINSIAAMTNASLDLDTILDNAIKSLIRLTRADHGVLYLLDEERPGNMRPIRYRGMTKREAFELIPVDTPTSMSWAALRQRRVIHVPDIHAVLAYPPLYGAGICSFVTIPLFSNERPIGSMNLGMRSAKPLQVYSIEALTSIGSQIGVALEHARLLTSMEREIEERRKAEAELRASEVRYQQIILASPEAIALTDVKGKYLLANELYARLFGYESREAFQHAGLWAKDVLTPEFMAQLQKIYHSLKIGETMSGLRGMMRRRDGSEFHVEISTAILRDAQGLPIGMIGIVRDVTEMHRWEEALRRSEERYRTLAEAAHDQIFIVDQNDQLVYVNQFASQFIAKSPSEMIGRPRSDFFGGSTGDRQRSHILKIFANGKPKYEENRIDLPGRVHWLGTWLAPIFDHEGKVIQVLGVARDITDYKETASRLAASEQRFRDTIERTSDGYFFIDNNGFVTGWNKAFLRILRFSQEDVDNLHITSHTDENARILLERLFNRVMSGETIAAQEMQIPVKDGELRWISFNARRVMRQGIVVGIEGFLRDVTEQVATLESLRTVSLRLVQVQEEERRRIAREIHDSLGQQLTALQLEVTAATHALKGGVEVPKALQDAVHTIEESITMAQNLCYDLRPPLLDDFGLEAALRDHVTEYQEKWGIAVDFTAEKLDHLLSRDAETALFRVAQEAMNNVLKHAQARMVRVRLGLYDGRIFLRIQDDGCGFEPEPVQSRGRSDHFGLMTMNERIELLGGELMVESRPGSGATITAWLPMSEGRNDENS